MSESTDLDKRIAADILVAALSANQGGEHTLYLADKGTAEKQSKAIADAYKVILTAVSTPST